MADVLTGYVKIALSQQAQKDAARAKLPCAQQQTYTLTEELIGEALDAGASVAEDGRIVLTMARGDELDVRPADAAEAVVAVVRFALVKEAQQEDERRKAAREWATREVERRLSYYGNEIKLPSDYGINIGMEELTALEPAAVAEALALVQVNVEQKKRERAEEMASNERINAERELEKEKEKAAVHARLVRLAKVAFADGDDTVRGRLALVGTTPLGLLPEDEALEVVTDTRLPSESDGLTLHEYVQLDDDDAPHREDDAGPACAGSSISFRVETPEEAGGIEAPEWEVITAIRKALTAAGLPEGEIQVHIAECSARRCPAGARRIGVLVKLDLGDGLVIEREYGAATDA